MRQGVLSEFLRLAPRPVAAKPAPPALKAERSPEQRARSFEPILGRDHRPAPRECGGGTRDRLREPREHAAAERPGARQGPARTRYATPAHNSDRTTALDHIEQSDKAAEARHRADAPSDCVGDAPTTSSCQATLGDAVATDTAADTDTDTAVITQTAADADAAAEEFATAAVPNVLLTDGEAEPGAPAPDRGLALALGLKAGPAEPRLEGEHAGLAHALGKVDGIGGRGGASATRPGETGTPDHPRNGSLDPGGRKTAQASLQAGLQGELRAGPQADFHVGLEDAALGGSRKLAAGEGTTGRNEAAPLLLVDPPKHDVEETDQPGPRATTAADAAEAASRVAAADGRKDARHPLVREVPLGAVPIEIGLRAMAGTKRFEIRLDPPDLGRIDVRLDMSEDGEVKAFLTVDKVETLALLQRDARTLERAFEQAGLKPSDSGVDLMLADQSLPGGHGRREGEGHDREERTAPLPTETIEETSARVLWRGRSGLDLRI